MMPIVRIAQRVQYTIIAKDTLMDTRMSWEAKGVLMYLLEKPDNWVVSPVHLAKVGQSGKNRIYRILKELETFGYCRKVPMRDEATKQFSKWEYFIYEQPLTEIREMALEPLTQKPLPEKPQMAIGPLVSTNKIINTKREVITTMSTEADYAVTLFDYWVSVMDKNRASTKLTPKRKKALNARLKDGYAVNQIKTAIDNCRADAWSMGANDRNTAFNDIELICRTGEKLESFISKQAPLTNDTKVNKNINTAAEWLRSAK